MKTLIAIPCMDMVAADFAKCLLDIYKPQGTHACFKTSSLIYSSRNLLSITAIENKFDYVLWLDSDMIVPNDVIPRMIKDLNDTAGDMVTGLYFKRKEPFTPVIYDRVEEPKTDEHGNTELSVTAFNGYHDQDSDLFRVQGCGFGCVMTSVKLLKAVWDNFGPAFAPQPWCGEDIAFCDRVNQLGYDIWCDREIKCGHIGQYVYTEKDWIERGDED